MLTKSWELLKTLGLSANSSFQKIPLMCLDAQPDLDEVPGSSVASKLWWQSIPIQGQQGDLPRSLQSPQMAVSQICLLSVLLLFCFLPRLPPCPSPSHELPPAGPTVQIPSLQLLNPIDVFALAGPWLLPNFFPPISSQMIYTDLQLASPCSEQQVLPVFPSGPPLHRAGFKCQRICRSP